MEDKPFSCPVTECQMTFANEDHLTVHKKKHELSLTLTPTPGFKNPFIDQTPTPTRFLNTLDSELFQDFQNDNPFDATFRKANSSNAVVHNFVIPESSALIASLPDSEVLNTPSITLPSEPQTPVSIKPNFCSKAKEINSQTYSENTDTLPFTPHSEQPVQVFDSQQNISNELSIENVNLTTLASASLPVLTETNQTDFQKSSSTRTSVVQTPVITSVGNSTVLKTSAIGVPTAVVVTRPPTNNITTVTPSQVTVVNEQSNHAKVQESAQAVVQSVCVTPMVQLMIRLPDGQTMPVQIPVMASATTPPAQPSQTVTSIAPQNTTTTSVAKLKLKEVLTMNRKSSSSSRNSLNGKVKPKSVQLLPDSLENLGLSLASSTPSQRPGHNGRKRKELSDDPDEKRKRSLERNRAAAIRCREKRKQWINALERKADELSQTNVHLQAEVNQLRDEVAHLKTLLLAHKDCPVTLQQKASCYETEREAYATVRINTSLPNVIQCEPNSGIVSPLNAEFMEIEVNSVQSSSDSSLTSDLSETSCKDR